MRCIKQWNNIVRDIMEASPLGPFETRTDRQKHVALAMR